MSCKATLFMHSNAFTYVWLCIAATVVLLSNSLQSFQPTSSQTTYRPSSSQPRFKTILIGAKILLIWRLTKTGQGFELIEDTNFPEWDVASVGPLGSLPFKFGQQFSVEPQHVVCLPCTHWYHCMLYYYQSCFVQPFSPATGTILQKLFSYNIKVVQNPSSLQGVVLQ
jgi:hypothetical protein